MILGAHVCVPDRKLPVTQLDVPFYPFVCQAIEMEWALKKMVRLKSVILPTSFKIHWPLWFKCLGAKKASWCGSPNSVHECLHAHPCIHVQISLSIVPAYSTINVNEVVYGTEYKHRKGSSSRSIEMKRTNNSQYVVTSQTNINTYTCTHIQGFAHTQVLEIPYHQSSCSQRKSTEGASNGFP